MWVKNVLPHFLQHFLLLLFLNAIWQRFLTIVLAITTSYFAYYSDRSIFISLFLSRSALIKLFSITYICFNIIISTAQINYSAALAAIVNPLIITLKLHN